MKRKPIRIFTGDIRTAHDVRKLVPCTYCSGFGRSDNLIALGQHHAHGRCYAAVNGRKALLELPNEQLQKLTIQDIGWKLMKALGDKVSS